MSPFFFCIKGCKLVSVPVKFILTEFRTGNENMFSYEEKISLIKKFYKCLKVLEPWMLELEMDYYNFGRVLPKDFGEGYDAPVDYLSIKYSRGVFGVNRLDINLNNRLIEVEGHFSYRLSPSTSPHKIAFLENHFSNPLAPTEIELEEFYLEHGRHYLLNSNLELVDPLTGEIV